VAPSPKNVDSKRLEELYDILRAAVGELSYLGAAQSNIIEIVQNTISRSRPQGGNKT